MEMLRKIKILFRFPARILLTFMFLICTVLIHAQSEKKYIREGNREYAKNNFSESEVSYRKAIDKNKQSPNAVFNIGDALYKQKKYEDAGKQFIESTGQNEDRSKKADGLYNLGNSLLQANKIEESIDAYKGSLKLKPDNMQAKYNLAYAQDLLKKQQQQKQQQQQQQQNQDQDKSEKNKGDKENNKEDQNDNKNQQNNQQKDQNNQDQQKQQPQQQQISKEDAQRLLNALANDEKKVQEKVKLAKAAKEQVRTVKNW
jgi:Ca-activated chloride channel family protein